MAVSSFTAGSNATEHQLFIRWNQHHDNKNGDRILCGGYVFQNDGKKNNDPSRTINDTASHQIFPIVYIPSDNPTSIDRQPCCIIAYAYRNHVDAASERGSSPNQANVSICHFSQDTLVRILPPRLAINPFLLDRQYSSSSLSVLPTTPMPSLFQFRRESMLHDLLGEEGSNNIITDTMIEEILRNHNQETVDELNLKLSAVMGSINIGTTYDAFRTKEKQEQQMRKIQKSIQDFSVESKQITLFNDKRKKSGSANSRSWPSLIVHSPNHADGKTLLVQALAKRLGCPSVHVIRPGALLAKYGIRADAALESQIHSILMSAACRDQKVCIILDQLDTMLPSRLSGRSSAGDAALPVFNAIASYLRKITASMQRKQELPFPMKNSLYNPSNGSSGQVVTGKLLLVGIVTCPDDGWKSYQKNNSGSTDQGSTILDCMVSDRYRIPLLTTKTILSAFDAAFAREGITLEASAIGRLAQMAGTAPWMRGSVFRRVAKQLKWILMNNSRYDKNSSEERDEATVQDFVKAIALVKRNVIDSAQIENSPEAEEFPSEKEDDLPSHFASIGGNVQAKVSLEDALAFDRGKREMLSKFGLSPPTGVLLYGPPGCGKTLLAKAVARLLKNPILEGTSSLESGGTFISLSISEIVSAEVGTSEKTIASSFEFAEKNAPSVIFLDEFQALFTDRNRGGSGKLTTTLLQCLDDIKRWYEIDLTVTNDKVNPSTGGKRVIVIGATNTPWMIDSAFLRPGRFDRVVHVGLPILSERKSILLVHIKRMRFCDNNIYVIQKLCEELSILTEGFSGADIAALCRAAAIRALEEAEGSTVKEYHFKDAMEHDVNPSSDDFLVKRLQKWRP
eukprot:CAMPEP_0168163188 /NCGR_PEP_ID=MMETSP0139_2-20121125/237_1 /TAXON_ID=44445 /ORGANISM="Pseudo-nitzschia australis, Strain 10249 10 AB" /LENGTH=850 /DNA_ID=CAMNT_0008080055 /DNA_START=62 /DNA_END=2614 /DNA_ORIENTATION=+